MAAYTILIEAESFGQKGGWQIDQQFVHLMGSPYLLAHGLGQPVADASTTVGIPAAGEYRLWVRTRNWVPGPWDPPGRFQVLVNGRPAAATFGTREGWGWQDGGRLPLAAGTASLRLHDLTGFDGRCDALVLSSEEGFTPPDDAGTLRDWRDRLAGRPATPPLEGRFDLVVVGGGISGCAAALAAASQGLTVALVHDRPVLGGNASSEVRVHTEGIHGHAGRVLAAIDTEHWPNGSAKASEDDGKRQAAMAAATGVRQFLNWRAYGVDMSGDRIRAVKAQHIVTGRVMAVEAPVFIDCTGDGWIGFWAGAELRYGREARDEFGEDWPKWGELWSPQRPDGRVMGASLLWSSREAEQPVTFPDVPWAAPVAQGHAAFKGEWFWEYSDDDRHAIDDAEAIRDHLLRAIYGSFANAKRQPGRERSVLEWVGYLSGKRESRRLIGDYVYSLKDAVSQTYFPDTVVQETRAIDVHFQKALAKDAKGAPDFLSEAIFRPVGRYYIPFRCLYSRNVANLMMAGRCFSSTHIGLGGPRVMNTCGQMGAATGYAAALCRKHGATPRQVGQDHLAELRALIGETGPMPDSRGLARTTSGDHRVAELPAALAGLPRITVARGAMDRPAPPFAFRVSLPVTVYLAVHDRGAFRPDDEWRPTGLALAWGEGHHDTVYSREWPDGRVDIPGHNGQQGNYYGLPHLVFLRPLGGSPASGLRVSDLPTELDACLTPAAP